MYIYTNYMNDLFYYDKYLKYKQKYINLKFGGVVEYIGKYFNVSTNNIEFSTALELELIKKKLIKKNIKNQTKNKFFNDYPVYFNFISGEATATKNLENNDFDKKRTKYNIDGNCEWLNILKGLSKQIICDKYILCYKFKDHKFIKNSDFIYNETLLDNTTINTNLNCITSNDAKIRILKPGANSFRGKGIKIINTIDKDLATKEIKTWLSNPENIDYKKWILQDYILNPDLLEGYKFHIRVIILVIAGKEKPTPISKVYMCKNINYAIAHEPYHLNDLSDLDQFNNKNIHDTHYNEKKPHTFPDKLPDGWTPEEIPKILKDIEEIISIIYDGQNRFFPDWNAKNGYELFGADIIYENKQPYLLEINSDMGLASNQSVIIPKLLDIVLDNNFIGNETFIKIK